MYYRQYTHVQCTSYNSHCIIHMYTVQYTLYMCTLYDVYISTQRERVGTRNMTTLYDYKVYSRCTVIHPSTPPPTHPPPPHPPQLWSHATYVRTI